MVPGISSLRVHCFLDRLGSRCSIVCLRACVQMPVPVGGGALHDVDPAAGSLVEDDTQVKALRAPQLLATFGSLLGPVRSPSLRPCAPAAPWPPSWAASCTWSCASWPTRWASRSARASPCGRPGRWAPSSASPGAWRSRRPRSRRRHRRGPGGRRAGWASEVWLEGRCVGWGRCEWRLRWGHEAGHSPGCNLFMKVKDCNSNNSNIERRCILKRV